MSIRGNSMTKRQFVLVVVARDTGQFTVEGPMSDDRLWNSAVVNAQRVGRNIRCFSMGILGRMSLQPNGTRLTGVAGLRLARSWGPCTMDGIEKGRGLVAPPAPPRRLAQSRQGGPKMPAAQRPSRLGCGR